LALKPLESQRFWCAICTSVWNIEMETLMRRMTPLIVVIFVSAGLLSFAGCDRDDAQKAGQKVESAADKAGDAIERGLDKAGEAANRGIQKANETAHDVAPEAKSAATRAAAAVGRGAEKAGDKIEQWTDTAQDKLSTRPATQPARQVPPAQ
jgi:hypothetical protein